MKVYVVSSFSEEPNGNLVHFKVNSVFDTLEKAIEKGKEIEKLYYEQNQYNSNKVNIQIAPKEVN